VLSDITKLPRQCLSFYAASTSRPLALRCHT
jgi:hypothetical protein